MIVSRLHWPRDRRSSIPTTTAALPTSSLPPAPPPPPPPPPPTTPIPPLSSLLQPHSFRPDPNTHIVSALLLQAIFLGGTTLGLLRRGEKSAIVKQRDDGFSDDVDVKEREQAKRTAERERERIAKNLILSSYAALSSPTVLALQSASLSASEGGEVAAVVEAEEVGRTRSRTALSPIAALLASYSTLESLPSLHSSVDSASDIIAAYEADTKVIPNSWTILAILAFISPPRSPSTSPSSPNSASWSITGVRDNGEVVQWKKRPYDLSRPILGMWAWRIFSRLQGMQSSELSQCDNSSTKAIDQAIVASFLDLLDQRSKDYVPFESTICDELWDELSTYMISSQSTSRLSVVPGSSESQLYRIGLIALRREEYRIVFDLLRDGSELSTRERLQLCVETLGVFSEDEEWRNAGMIIHSLATTFASSVRSLVVPIPDDEVGPELIGSIERGIRLLLDGFGINIALEHLITSSVLHLIPPRSTPTLSDSLVPSTRILFTDDFILGLLTSLVHSRNPKFAFQIFDALPPSYLTLSHYNILLRSHRLRTSTTVWHQLLLHPTLQPNVHSFHSRIVSHAAKSNNDLTGLRHATQLMQRRGIPLTRKIRNKILSVVSRVGSDRMFRRQVRRIPKGDRDEATESIILSRGMYERERGVREEGDVRGRRKRSGILQMGRMRMSMKEYQERRKHQFGDGKRVMGGAVGENILLKGAGRWSREVSSDKLMEIAERVLRSPSPPVDPSLSLPDPATADMSTPRSELDVNPEESDRLAQVHQFDTIRRPAYRMLIKGFKARGDRSRSHLLQGKLARERREIRQRSRASIRLRDGENGMGARAGETDRERKRQELVHRNRDDDEQEDEGYGSL